MISLYYNIMTIIVLPLFVCWGYLYVVYFFLPTKLFAFKPVPPSWLGNVVALYSAEGSWGLVDNLISRLNAEVLGLKRTNSCIYRQNLRTTHGWKHFKSSTTRSAHSFTPFLKLHKRISPLPFHFFLFSFSRACGGEGTPMKVWITWWKSEVAQPKSKQPKTQKF